MLVYQRVAPVSMGNIGDLYPLRKKKCRLAVKIGNTYHLRVVMGMMIHRIWC